MTVFSQIPVPLRNKKKNPYTLCCKHKKVCQNKRKPVTQVSQSSVIDECVAHVDVLQKGIFVIQKVPVELAPLVCNEPLCLANKPEDTKDDNMNLCNIWTELIHLKLKQNLICFYLNR